MYEYLNEEVFFCRQSFAAHLLRDVEHVIEIGGYTTTIQPFLLSHQTSVTIDPEIGNPDGVTRIKSTFQEFQFNHHDNYGVVILGLQLLDMKKKDWNNLYKLINGSQTTVIEAPNWHESKRQLNLISKNINKTQVWSVLMNLSENDVNTWFTKRHMYCFR